MSDSSQSSRPQSPNAPPQRVVSGSLKERIAKFENLGAGGNVPAPRSFDRGPSHARGGIVGNRIPSLDPKTAGLAGASGVSRRVSERRELIGNRIPSSGLPQWPTGSTSGASATGGESTSSSRPASRTGGGEQTIGLGRPTGSSVRSASPALSVTDSASASSATLDSAHSGSAPTSRTSSPATSAGQGHLDISLPDQGDAGAMTPSSTRADLGEDLSDISMPVTPIAGGTELPSPGYDLVPGSLSFAARSSAVAAPASLASSLRSEYNPVSEGEESVNLRDVSGVSTPIGTPRQAHRGLDDDASSVGAGSLRSVGPSSVAGSSRARSEAGDIEARTAGLQLDAGTDQDQRPPVPEATEQTIPSIELPQESKVATKDEVADEATAPVDETTPKAEDASKDAELKPEDVPSSAESTKSQDASVHTEHELESSNKTSDIKSNTKSDTKSDPKPHADNSLPAALAESMSTELLAQPDRLESKDISSSPSSAGLSKTATGALAGTAAVGATVAGANAVAKADPSKSTTSDNALRLEETKGKDASEQDVVTPRQSVTDTSSNTREEPHSSGNGSQTKTADQKHDAPVKAATGVNSSEPTAKAVSAGSSNTASKPESVSQPEPASKPDPSSKPEPVSKPEASAANSTATASSDVKADVKSSTDATSTHVSGDGSVNGGVKHLAGSESTTEAGSSSSSTSAAPLSHDDSKPSATEPRVVQPPAVDHTPADPTPAVTATREQQQTAVGDSKSLGLGVPRSHGLSDLAAANGVHGADNLKDRDITPNASHFPHHQNGLDLDREATPVPDGFTGGDVSDEFQPPPALDDDSDIVSVMGGAMSERDIGSPLASNRSSMPPARASSELEFRFEDLHERFFRESKNETGPSPAAGDAAVASGAVASGNGHASRQASNADLKNEVVGGKSASDSGDLNGAVAAAGAAATGAFAIKHLAGESTPSEDQNPTTAVAQKFPSVPKNEIDGSPSRRPLQVHVEPSPFGVVSDRSADDKPSLHVSAPSTSESSSTNDITSVVPDEVAAPKPVPDFPNAPRNTLKTPVPDSDPCTPQTASFPSGSTPTRTLTPMTPGFLLSFPQVPDETHPYVGVHVSPTRTSISGPDHPRIPFPRHGINSPNQDASPRRASSLKASPTAGTFTGNEGDRTSITPPSVHQAIVPSAQPFDTPSANLSVETLESDREPGSRSPRRKRHSFTPRSPYLDDEDPGDFEPGEGWALVSKWEPWRGSPPYSGGRG